MSARRELREVDVALDAEDVDHLRPARGLGLRDEAGDVAGATACDRARQGVVQEPERHGEVEIDVGSRLRIQRRGRHEVRAQRREQLAHLGNEAGLFHLLEHGVVRTVHGVEDRVRRDEERHVTRVEGDVTVGERRVAVRVGDDEAVLLQRGQLCCRRRHRRFPDHVEAGGRRGIVPEARHLLDRVTSCEALRVEILHGSHRSKRVVLRLREIGRHGQRDRHATGGRLVRGASHAVPRSSRASAGSRGSPSGIRAAWGSIRTACEAHCSDSRPCAKNPGAEHRHV